MADEQEKQYEVKDKRRLNPDGTLKEPEEPEAAAPEETRAQEVSQEQAQEASEVKEAEAQAEAETQEGEAEAPTPNVYAFLGFMVSMLAEQAWQLMGIQLAPGHKEPTVDMAQAKVAIDTIVFITDKLHPHISEQERLALRGLISDMQINFVRHSQ